jgi:hypothetical protein
VPATPAEAQARRDGVDIGRVMETVSHRVVADPSGVLVSEDDAYRATFDADGFEVGAADGTGDGLRVSTNRIAVGSAPVGITAGAWRPDANVAARALGSDIVERVTATEGQVEWDVVIGSRLPGDGDLRIDAEVVGASGPPVRGADGLRWELGDGRSMVMGDLVVKDRGGAERYRATPGADAHGVTLTVPASVLAGADYPLTVDPTVSPEHPVSDPVLGPASGAQDAPAVAFDGTNYLVVWDDYRSATSIGVFGARVSRTGVLLDPTGIAIATGPGDHAGPAVAFDGTNFLVAWTTYLTPSQPETDIYSAQVDPAGTVGGASLISDLPYVDAQFQMSPAIAFDGTNFLVVWQVRGIAGFPPDVYGVRVNRSGSAIGSPWRIGWGSGGLADAAVAFDGVNFLVVWTAGDATGGDIYGNRVTPAGMPLDGDRGRPIATGPGAQHDPAIAFDGTNHLVAWSDTRSGSEDIYAARVDRAGAVLDGTGIPVSTAAGDQLGPAVAFDGTNSLIAWSDNRSGTSFDVYGARVSPTGAVLDGGGLAISTAPADQGGRPDFDRGRLVVASDGTNHLVLWPDLRAGRPYRYETGISSDVFGARVSRAGAVLDGSGIAVSPSANRQSDPAVSFDGTNYLVVWTDGRADSTAVYAARVTPAGEMLDGAGILIASGPADRFRPAVSFDGTNHLVVWEGRRSDAEGSDVYGVRVSRAGVVLGSPFVVSFAGDGAEAPAVAFDGTNFLVVWAGHRSVTGDGIYGARVSRAGVVLDRTPISVVAGALVEDPAVTFAGTDFLVVWSTGDPGYQDLRGARVGRSGAVLDDPSIAISTTRGAQVTPAVASDGSNALVVWSDGRAPNVANIYAARIDRAGTVLEPDGIQITDAGDQQREPSVVANGSFLVVWRDDRWFGGEIKGTRINSAGRVVDGAAIPIATSTGDELAPAAVAGPGNRFGVIYQRDAFEDGYGSSRVFMRTVAPK